MKLHHAVAGALALALMSSGALAQNLSRSLSATTIDVWVESGDIRVSQTSVSTATGTVSLVWQLRTEGYKFSSNSIDFGATQVYFSCATFNSGMSIRCTKSDKTPRGQLSYSIRLSDGQSTVELPPSNVFIQNE